MSILSPNFNTEQAFAVKVCMGLAPGGWFVVWTAYQHQPVKLRAWMDVYLGTILGGIIGARVVYILFNLEFFLNEPLNIPRLWFAELAWQGAIVGGLLAMRGMCRWRDVDFHDFGDGMALAIPVVFMAVCWSARSAGLILGAEVQNIDDLPVWSASFLPDLNRFVAPRYEVQMLGVGLGAVMLWYAGILTLFNRLSGLRLWIILGMMAIAIGIVDDYSSEAGAFVRGLRMNLVSAVILGVFSVMMAVRNAYAKHRVRYFTR